MKQRKQYTTDLKDKEWDILETYLEELLPKNRRGRPLAFDLRLLVDAIRYVLRNGCTWRDLPSDFPKWQTVYYHFAKWRKLGIWTKLNRYLREELRKELDRNEEPSAGCADSQSMQVACMAMGMMVVRRLMAQKDTC